ncbi:hypothetical protein ACFSTI_06115 [Rhizorhabdus histidinilytica]
MTAAADRFVQLDGERLHYLEAGAGEGHRWCCFTPAAPRHMSSRTSCRCSPIATA